MTSGRHCWRGRAAFATSPLSTPRTYLLKSLAKSITSMFENSFDTGENRQLHDSVRLPWPRLDSPSTMQSFLVTVVPYVSASDLPCKAMRISEKAHSLDFRT